MAETNRSTHSTDCLCVYIANRISCCRADRTHTHTQVHLQQETARQTPLLSCFFARLFLFSQFLSCTHSLEAVSTPARGSNYNSLRICPIPPAHAKQCPRLRKESFTSEKGGKPPRAKSIFSFSLSFCRLHT